MISRTAALCVAVTAPFALAACMVASVKDINADKPGYLNGNFSEQSMGDGVREEIYRRDSTPPGAGRLKLVFDVTITKSDGKAELSKSAVSLEPLGHGLVRELWEYSSNDIPYLTRFALSYRGLVHLRSQGVSNGAVNPPPLYEVKRLGKLSDGLAQPAEERDYEIEYAEGWTTQLVNLMEGRIACRSAKLRAAAKVHPKLEGQALDLECSYSANNAVYQKRTLVYLPKYGVSLVSEIRRSGATEAYKLVDVAVE